MYELIEFIELINSMNKTEEHTSKQNPGMKCPQCGAFIEFTISQLLTVQALECPHCHLRLTINHQSKRASEALSKLQEAQEKLKEKK